MPENQNQKYILERESEKEEKRGRKEKRRQREREREIYYRNWLMKLWRPRSPTICCLQAGEPEKPVL